VAEVKIKTMTLNEFLSLAPSEHPPVGDLELAINEVLGTPWEDSYNLKDGKGELRAFLNCVNNQARLVFLNYAEKPQLPVVVVDDTRKVTLKDKDLRADISVSGTEFVLAISTTDWKCRELEIYIARDKNKSLSLWQPRSAVIRWASG